MTYQFSEWWSNHNRNRKDVDFVDWEIDDETGEVGYVILHNIKRTYYNKQLEKPCDWCKKNIKSDNDWFWCYESEGCVFYFKRYNDALIFKLIWS